MSGVRRRGTFEGFFYTIESSRIIIFQWHSFNFSSHREKHYSSQSEDRSLQLFRFDDHGLRDSSCIWKVKLETGSFQPVGSKVSVWSWFGGERANQWNSKFNWFYGMQHTPSSQSEGRYSLKSAGSWFGTESSSFSTVTFQPVGSKWSSDHKEHCQRHNGPRNWLRDLD